MLHIPSDLTTQPLSTNDYTTWMLLRMFSHPGGDVYAVNGADVTSEVKRVLARSFHSADVDRIASAAAHSPHLQELVSHTVSREYHASFDHQHTVIQAAVNEVVSVFMEKLQSANCIDVSEHDPLRHRTLLHVAIEASHDSLAMQLIESGASLAAVDVFGWTALHMAARQSNLALYHTMLNMSLVRSDLASLPAARDWLGRTAADIITLRSHAPHTVDGNADLSGGGWSGYEATELLHTRCDIPEVSADITSDEFINQFVSLGRAVVIRGGARGMPMLEQWTFETFTTELSDIPFPLVVAPYSQVYGSEANFTTLGAFSHFANELSGKLGRSPESRRVDETMPYVFTELNSEQALRFANSLDGVRNSRLLSALPHAMRSHLPQFFVGPAYSGAQMHFHQDAINVLAYGRKRWFLTPPSAASFTTVPVMHWYHTQYPKLIDDGAAVLECVQNAGDVMYVPMEWGHAIINTRMSIGVATNFESPFRTF